MMKPSSEKWRDLAFPTKEAYLFPNIINVEVYRGDCPCGCVHCPVGVTPRSERRRRFTPKSLDLELFDKITREVSQYPWSTVRMHSVGDPLLWKGLTEALDIVKRNKTRAWIFTSAVTEDLSLLEAMCENARIVEVSINSISREDYLATKGVDCFQQVFENLSHMRRVCQNNLKTRLIVSRTQTPSETADQEFVDYWKNSHLADDAFIRSYHTYNDLLPSLNRKKHKEQACLVHWARFNISADGDAVVCFNELFRKEVDQPLIFGNLKKDSIARLWRGEWLSSLRRAELDGDYSSLQFEDVLPCKRCGSCQPLQSHGPTSETQVSECKENTIRYFQEDPIFDAFTRFDPVSGRLSVVNKEEFQAKKGTVFTGDTFETHTRFPRRIYFQITRSCNMECAYCFLKSGKGQPHLPVENALEMASYLGANGLMEVRLTGGEPTLHPEFFRIADGFYNSHVYVSVATNGLLSEHVLRGVAERKNLWIICSIDGDRETHNHYRPDSYDRILSNLSFIKEQNPDLRLRLTCVLTKRNMDQIPALGALTKSLDAESITLIPLRPKVRDKKVMEDMITASEFKGVLETMVKTMDDLNIKMTTTLALDHESRIFKDPIVRKRGACAAGREAANLDYDAGKGTFLLYGCSYSPAPDLDLAPNIRQPFLAGEFPVHRVEEFYRIWNHDPAWAIYRDPSFKYDPCKTCHYYARNRCIGSCPIQNADYEGLDVNADVAAQLKSQLSQTAEWYCYKQLD